MKGRSTNYRRYRIKLYGIVQGVGFRPFVYNKAMEYKISGSVINAGGAVIIHCFGMREDIKRFILDIVQNPPSLAKIEKIECTKVHEKEYKDTNGFIIKSSIQDENQVKFVSPDVATCSNCLRDIQRKGSARYQYAFTNCTQCGPRFSIINALPYDREYTTMKKFQMCESCQLEYENPKDRRFHAQPNCCEKCGPKLTLIDNNGQEIKSEDAIGSTINLLEKEKIIAIKGIGGFHLVCDARNKEAITILRGRKHRNEKPLALMAKNMNIIKQICWVSEKEEEILLSNRRPIVLLIKKEPSFLPDEIAPRLKRIGVMLPYTPLQSLLLENSLNLLVMTSGNISGMPIEYKNEAAIKNLRAVADYFLLHDRDICMPVDDSVVRVVAGREVVSRSARGYSPYTHKVKINQTLVAIGSDQKNSICVTKNNYGNLSQYLGNLVQYSCYENFQYVLSQFIRLFDIEIETVVYDMHPDYISAHYAKTWKVRLIGVWHHHAHMVSCMAEHGIEDQVIGVIFDGTGYGLDGAVWGGEFLVGNQKTFLRAGHLEYVRIQGGEQGIKEPWRCALSYLNPLGYEIDKYIQGVDPEEIQGVRTALNAGINCFLSSSMGRLFDAVASLVGIRNYISYEGQAAIELENEIQEEIEESYLWDIIERNGVLQIQYKEIIEGVINDIHKKEDSSIISVKFHNTVANATCALVSKLREREKINKVVLSGGVFENQYLLMKIYKDLKEKEFEVFFNQQVPINDGGISFGQIHIASASMEKEEKG